MYTVELRQETGPTSRRLRVAIVCLYLGCAATGVASQHLMSSGGMMGSGVSGLLWILLSQASGGSIQFAPALHGLYPYAWFVSLLLAGLTYLVLSLALPAEPVSA